jgi:molybdopterin-guanine dinucleotide biosynthesis protein A
VHQEVGPYVRAAMERGEFKLFPVLEGAARSIGEALGVATQTVLLNENWDAASKFTIRPRAGAVGSWWVPTEGQEKARDLWFANLNTPREFMDVEGIEDALDT